MKIGAKTTVCLLGLLILVPAGLAAINDAPPAAEFSTGDQPYSAIWTRNVFDLTPKPPVEAPKSTAPPPPNVKLIGIYTLFGNRAILTLQEPSARPGQPAGKEESFTMREGESHNGVELLEVDPKGRKVKIKNEEGISTIAMETNHPAGGAPGPGAIAGGAPHPFAAPPAFTPTSLPMNQGGGVQLPPRQMRSTDNSQPNQYGGPAYGATGYQSGGAGVNLSGLFNQPTQQASSPAPLSNMTAEEQVALMMAQHTAHESAGIIAPPMPPIPGVTDNTGNGSEAPPTPQPPQAQLPDWLKARAHNYTLPAPPAPR